METPCNWGGLRFGVYTPWAVKSFRKGLKKRDLKIEARIHAGLGLVNSMVALKTALERKR